MKKKYHLFLFSCGILLFFFSFSQNGPEYSNLNIYNYKNITNFSYFISKDKSDNKISWSIRKRKSDSFEQVKAVVVGNLALDNILDFNVIQNLKKKKDSFAIILATKLDSSRVRKKWDSTTVYKYKIYLNQKPPFCDSVFIKQLHYYYFDENGLIGITDSTLTGIKTYYLSETTDEHIDQIDGSSLNGFYLYPSRISGNNSYFILRDTSTSLFTIASHHQNELHKLYNGLLSVAVQFNNTIIGKTENSYRLYKPNSNNDISVNEYSFIENFPSQATYTVSKKLHTKDWCLISDELKEINIRKPDSCEKILTLSVFPVGNAKKNYFLVKAGNESKFYWFYGQDIIRDTVVLKEEIKNSQAFNLKPFYDGFVFIQHSPDSIFLKNLNSKIEPKKVNIEGIDIDNIKYFKLYDHTTDSCSYLVIGRFTQDKSKTLAILFQVSKTTNASTVKFRDTIIADKYFVSDRLFLYFKKDGSKFWSIRNLLKNPDGVIKYDSLIIVKPFIDINRKYKPGHPLTGDEYFISKAIKLQPDNTELEITICYPDLCKNAIQ